MGNGSDWKQNAQCLSPVLSLFAIPASFFKNFHASSNEKGIPVYCCLHAVLRFFIFLMVAEDGVLQAESSPHTQPPSPGGCSRIAWWRLTECPQHIPVSPECHCVPWWLIEEVMLEGSMAQSHQASVCTLRWGERPCLAPHVLPSYAQLQLVTVSLKQYSSLLFSSDMYAMEMVTASPVLLPAPFWFYSYGCPLPQH